jgi:hypothetical protein
LVLFCVVSSAHADTFLNIYGTAKHTENDANLNDTNYGLGLRNESGNVIYEAGAFRDSRDNLSKYAAVGYQYRLGIFGFGASALAMSRPNYRDGNVFMGALPFITLNAKSIITTVTCVPAYERFAQTFFVYWSINPFLTASAVGGAETPSSSQGPLAETSFRMPTPSIELPE